jgi:hypothetical protein
LPPESKRPNAGSCVPKTTPPPLAGRTVTTVSLATVVSRHWPRPPSVQYRIQFGPPVWGMPPAKSIRPSMDHATLWKFWVYAVSVLGRKIGERSRPETTATLVESSKPTATWLPSGEKFTEAGLSPPSTLRLATNRRARSPAIGSYSRKKPSQHEVTSRPAWSKSAPSLRSP